MPLRHLLPILLLVGAAGCRTQLLNLLDDLDGGLPEDLSGVPAPDLVDVPRCGNGVLDPGEACDDANADESDGCRNDCTRARCGDGVVWKAVEECDDGNQVDDDGCRNTCGLPRCGDGVLQAPEQCDDGNADPTDDCLPSCLPAFCGDGFVRVGPSAEECDDGNQQTNDGCIACRPARCGDGFVRAGEGGEQCDDGNGNDLDLCDNACKLPVCGDGKRAGNEQCDDGNADNTDGCVAGCVPARCGDGFTQAGVEQCDDGNQATNDACVMCRNARCGDGFTFAGVEQCDDGNPNDLDFCDNACKTPVCGDGKRAGGEQCDLGAKNGDRPAFLVSQPSGTAIGTNPMVQKKTAVAFYNYFSASSHTGFEQVGESRIYLYVDANTGRLSLVLTHGIDFDATGQSQPSSSVNMDVTGIPPGFVIDVEDDPGVNPREFAATGPTTAAGRWNFNQNSDGGVLGGLPFPGVWKITVTPKFAVGLNTWGWVRDDLKRIPMVMAEPITIEAFDSSSACRKDCSIPRCGDKILDGGEICDDGNNVTGDGCANDCKSLR